MSSENFITQLTLIATWLDTQHPGLATGFIEQINFHLGTQFASAEFTAESTLESIEQSTLLQLQDQATLTAFLNSVFASTDLNQLTTSLQSYSNNQYQALIRTKARLQQPTKNRLRSYGDNERQRPFTLNQHPRAQHRSSRPHSAASYRWPSNQHRYSSLSLARANDRPGTRLSQRRASSRFSTYSRVSSYSRFGALQPVTRSSRILSVAAMISNTPNPLDTFMQIMGELNIITPIPAENVVTNPVELTQYLLQVFATVSDDQIDELLESTPPASPTESVSTLVELPRLPRLPRNRDSDLPPSSSYSIPEHQPLTYQQPRISASTSVLPTRQPTSRPRNPSDIDTRSQTPKTLLKKILPKSMYGDVSKRHFFTIDLYSEAYKRTIIAEYIRSQIPLIQQNKRYQQLLQHLKNREQLARELATFINQLKRSAATGFCYSSHDHYRY